MQVKVSSQKLNNVLCTGDNFAEEPLCPFLYKTKVNTPGNLPHSSFTVSSHPLTFYTYNSLIESLKSFAQHIEPFFLCRRATATALKIIKKLN